MSPRSIVSDRNGDNENAHVVPDGITLPAGLTAEAFTLTPDWYAVVTEGGSRILIFSRRSGALLQTVEVESAP